MTNKNLNFEKERNIQKTLFDTFEFYNALKNGGFDEHEAITLKDEIYKLLTYLTGWHFATKSEVEELESRCITKDFIIRKIKIFLSIIGGLSLITGLIYSTIKIILFFLK